MRKSFSKLIVACILSSAAASASRARADAAYNVVYLGTLGNLQNVATAINRSGQVAGYSIAGSTVGNAFLYSGGMLSDIGNLGGTLAEANAISNSGQIVGYSSVSTGALHAFSYTAISGMADIGTLGGASANSFSYGVNDSGTVVGRSTLSNTGGLEAFSYSGATGMVGLGYLPGGSRSEAFAINNAGTITGDSNGTFSGANVDTILHGFTYSTATNTFTDLGSLSGMSGDSTARAINSFGEVVGESQNVAGNYDAFSYTGAGGMTDLGTLAGGTISLATAVNDAGVIVGSSNTLAGPTHAFIDNGVTMTDLNTLISPTLGWTLTHAQGINNAGTIVGYGTLTGVSGQSAFELIAPTPQKLTWNNGGMGDGNTWDTTQLNWNNGTGTTTFNDTYAGYPGGDIVTFNDSNNGHYNVSIVGVVTPTSTTVNTNSSTGYTFTGSGGIGGTGGFNKLGTGSVTLAVTNTYSGPTNLSGGTMVIGSAAALPFGTNLNLNASGASLVVQSLGSAYAITVGTLSILAGTVDLKNNDMVVHTGTLSAVSSLVRSGFNNGGWNGGTGILSSSAGLSAGLMALGAIVNDNGLNFPLYGTNGTIAPTFGDATPSDEDVLVKYTFYGDANLDGKVDGTDYSRIDSGYSSHSSGWYNGDFNYDGMVNGSDYTLIDNAFNTQATQVAAGIGVLNATNTDEVADTSPIPEPNAQSLVALFATGMIRFRFRRRKIQ